VSTASVVEPETLDESTALGRFLALNPWERADAIEALPPDELRALDEALAASGHPGSALARGTVKRALAGRDFASAMVASYEPAAPVRPKPRIARVDAGRPSTMTKPPAVVVAASSMVASATGRTLATSKDLADEMLKAALDLMRGPNVVARRTVATSRAEFPSERMLGADIASNTGRLAAVCSPAALVASGGLCVPVNQHYEVAEFATTARPIRDSLPLFGASRGGVNFSRPLGLSDVSDGLTVWTVANDENPSNPATKNVLVVDCPTPVEVLVQAIVQRARFGNFLQRFGPEWLSSVLGVLAAAHARTAELELVNAMVSGSTAVTTAEHLSATRDVLASLDRAAAGQRARLRLSPTAVVRVIGPAWLRDAIRADLARQAPGDDKLAVTDADIQALFTARAMRVTWSDDWQSMSTVQVAGTLNGWPDQVSLLLYPEGTWAFVSGGTLDLGVARDSTLNDTNDAEILVETFEAAAKFGNDSVALTADICPSGWTSGPLSASDFDPCATGS
jgi:hypothetical protein